MANHLKRQVVTRQKVLGLGSIGILGSEQVCQQGVGCSWASERSTAVVGQLGAGSGTCVEAITLTSGLGCQLLEMGPCQHGGRRTVKRGLQRNHRRSGEGIR